jgi:hypothetical protein
MRSYYFEPNEDRNDKSITIFENDRVDTGLLDLHGRKLYRDETIKMGFDLRISNKK